MSRFFVFPWLMRIDIKSLRKTFVAGIIRLFNTFVLATNAINIVITFFCSSIHKPSFAITLQNLGSAMHYETPLHFAVT